MIKADYSVHLQIKGAEPISTPTFNTGDDQGGTAGRAKMGAFYSLILRSELFPTAIISGFPFIGLCRLKMKGYQNNPEKLPVIIV